jgi:hypothetical protein
MTLKSLSDTVRSQGLAIKDLERQISNKASKSELNSGLNIKANVADVMRSFSELTTIVESRPNIDEVQSYLDEKVSKTDLQYYMNSKPSIEEVRNLMETKLSTSGFQENISELNYKIEDYQKDIFKRLQNFASLKDVNSFNQILGKNLK